jgi:hypothetical protein
MNTNLQVISNVLVYTIFKKDLFSKLF